MLTMGERVMYMLLVIMIAHHKLKEYMFSYLLWVSRKRNNTHDIIRFSVELLFTRRTLINLYKVKIELLKKLRGN